VPFAISPTIAMRRPLILLFSIALASPVGGAAGAGNAPSAEQVRQEVRRAVVTHRAQQRDDIRRQEAAAGRRLTAAERAELREQVRYQWLLPASGSVSPVLNGQRGGTGSGSSVNTRRLRP
jgi:hypothetical protein